MFNDLRSKISRPISGIILLIIALAVAAFSGVLMKALSVSLSIFHGWRAQNSYLGFQYSLLNTYISYATDEQS